jgi:hypothetical protein
LFEHASSYLIQTEIRVVRKPKSVRRRFEQKIARHAFFRALALIASLSDLVTIATPTSEPRLLSVAEFERDQRDKIGRKIAFWAKCFGVGRYFKKLKIYLNTPIYVQLIFGPFSSQIIHIFQNEKFRRNVFNWWSVHLGYFWTALGDFFVLNVWSH